MISIPTIHDLRNQSSNQVTAAALDCVKTVRHGVAVTLILAQEPSLLMASLNLQLHESLGWDIVEAGGAWHVTVRDRADIEASDVLALLVADHKSINGLLARVLGFLNQGDAATAAPLLRAFIAALDRHVAFEDGELAAIIGVTETVSNQSAAVMLHEHHEISQQLAQIKKLLAQNRPDAAKLAVHCGLLSDTLAKHDYREEHNLFPQWQAALLERDEAARVDLLRRAKQALAMA